MKYFRYLPQLDYEFTLPDGTSFKLTLTNPTVRYKLVARLKQHISTFYDYVVSDGERPDTVATKLYGSPDYTWVILIANNIFSLYDWPLRQDEFDRYITERYGSIAAAQSQFYYRTVDGYVVDATTYSLMPAEERGAIHSHYDDELTRNEAKRRIKVLPAAFVEPLVLELRRQ